MIIETTGDILASTAQTLTCPVNTVGAMGAGVAKAFKEKYPKMFDAYRKACKAFYFSRYRNFVYTVSDERKILCLPTKMHFKYPSKIEWLNTALWDLSLMYEKYGITELAMPALGCGKGGLPWEEVRPLIYKHLSHLPITVYLYLPSVDVEE